jgi:hypothetical protein
MCSAWRCAIRPQPTIAKFIFFMCCYFLNISLSICTLFLAKKKT